mgnify:CR=1 FL=1
MTSYQDRAGLQVAEVLIRLIEDEVLPGLDLSADAFWAGAATIFQRFASENRTLLKTRDDLQARIDDWHAARRGQPHDAQATESFLREIGYLTPCFLYTSPSPRDRG